MSARNGGIVVLEILATVLAGMGIGLSLGAPPGPVNAIIASHTVTRSWRAGFLLWITVFPLALREAQRRIARTYQAVLAFSIVCLLAFAAWLVWSALTGLV